MNELQVFKNEMFKVAAQLESGEILFDVENVAKSLGFTQVKNNKEYIRWETVNRYINKYISQEVGKGDFIPETLVYKLAFKANNEVAEKFQDWLAIEVIPSIRKHGGYIKNQENISSEELLANAVLVAQNVIKEKDRLLEEQRPKVLFAEAVENSEDVILVKEMANILSQRGFDIGQNQLYQFLRDKEYLCKRKGDMYHLPTKRYQHFFKVTKRVVQNSKGSSVKNTPKITGKGQIYFIKKFDEFLEQGLTVRDLLKEDKQWII